MSVSFTFYLSQKLITTGLDKASKNKLYRLKKKLQGKVADKSFTIRKQRRRNREKLHNSSQKSQEEPGLS